MQSLREYELKNYCEVSSREIAMNKTDTSPCSCVTYILPVSDTLRFWMLRGWYPCPALDPASCAHLLRNKILRPKTLSYSHLVMAS